MSLSNDKSQMVVDFSPDDVYSALLVVLQDSGIKISSSNEKSRTINAKIGANLWSWGENITIIVNPDINGGASVLISSASKMFAATDWGKNAKNITDIMNKLAMHLENGDYKKTSSAVSEAAPDVFEQIKKLSELKESGILDEEEFQTKKAELLKKI